MLTLLNDPEWKQWSDREIARLCKVDHKTVGKIRKSLTGEIPSDPSTSLTAEVPSEDLEEINEHLRTYRTKHGTIATMNTTNIGKNPEEERNNTIKVTTDEVLIAFLSNLEQMTPEQVKAAIKAIASSHPEIIKNMDLTD